MLIRPDGNPENHKKSHQLLLAITVVNLARINRSRKLRDKGMIIILLIVFLPNRPMQEKSFEQLRTGIKNPLHRRHYFRRKGLFDPQRHLKQQTRTLPGNDGPTRWCYLQPPRQLEQRLPLWLQQPLPSLLLH